MWKKLALCCALWLGLGFNTSFANPKPIPEIHVFSYNKGLDQQKYLWRNEVAKKFEKANVILCHGKYINGVWFAVPDDDRGKPKAIDRWARDIKKVDPNVPLVIISCNARGHLLEIEGVYQFDNVVSSVPHSDVEWFWKDEKTKSYARSLVGSIKDIVTYDPLRPYPSLVLRTHPQAPSIQNQVVAQR